MSRHGRKCQNILEETAGASSIFLKDRKRTRVAEELCKEERAAREVRPSVKKREDQKC